MCERFRQELLFWCGPSNDSTSTNGEEKSGCFCQELQLRFTGKILEFPLFCDLGLGDEAIGVDASSSRTQDAVASVEAVVVDASSLV